MTEHGEKVANAASVRHRKLSALLKAHGTGHIRPLEIVTQPASSGESRPAADVVPGVPPPPIPDAAASGPESEAALAELLALLPRVNGHWRSYIRTRLEVDTGSVERLRHVRDWTLAHAELAPAERPNCDAAPLSAADD